MPVIGEKFLLLISSVQMGRSGYPKSWTGDRGGSHDSWSEPHFLSEQCDAMCCEIVSERGRLRGV
jgi:hypothetical protein